MPFLSSPRSRLPGILSAGLVILGSFGPLPEARAATQPNDGFDPSANALVTTLALQPDGKILMGGYFTQLHPFGNAVSGSGHVARLNTDGTVDRGFSPNANDVVRILALQPNGQVLIGGNFTTVQPTGGASPIVRNHAARLNSDGTLDNVFNPNANGVVYAIAYQPNGQILIGGSFTTVQPNGAPAPVTRNHIARFNADGSLDASFDPNADRTVLSVAVQPNGQILVGGGFSTLKPNGAAATTARSCAARLNADGTLDAGFDPEPNASVDAILVLPSGQIILGGQFISLQPNGATSTVQCDFLARLNTDGTLDKNYIVNPLASVTTVALQPDGKLLVGGTFTQLFPENNLAATSISYVARVNIDGSLDSSFLPTPNQAVNAIAVQPDGNVVLGGYFTSFQPIDSTAQVPRNYIARVTTYGIPDATLAPDNSGTVFATAMLPNGQILAGGTFLSIGGVTRNYLARLNADGSLDGTFTPTLNGPVQAIKVQPNGQILLGGAFSQVNGFARNFMARLNPDGTLDGAFNPSPNSNLTAIGIQSNGQILIGGGFTSITPNGSTSSFGISNLARLNSDGSLDVTFHPTPSGAVYSILVLADGRIVVGGSFTSIAGATRGYIARLLATGAIDPAAFDPEANLPVFAMVLQTDGKLIIGGSFTGVIPQTGKTGTPTVTTGPYGTVTLPAPGTSATTPIYINHLARLNTDGTLDTTFYPDPSSDVLALALQADGKIVVGGVLTSFAQNGAPTGVTRNYIGRVNPDGSLDAGFDPDANALINSVSVLPNGHILVGGSFTTLQPNGSSSPTYANHLAVLSPDGTVDTTFTLGSNAAANGRVNTFAQQPNGQVLVGGTFGPSGGSPASYLARFNPDGSPDVTYNTSIDGPVNAIAVLPNGAATLTPTNAGVWLESNGSVRHAYAAASNGEIVSVVQQADGKVILGGLFSNFAGVAVQNIVRLNTDGTVDTTFLPTLNGVVSAIVIQPDGKILIGGGFGAVDASTTSYLARLNPDGTLDTAFAPEPNLQVRSLALQANGQIIVTGDFTFLAPTAKTAASRSYIARVNADGTIDTSFNPNPSGPVYSSAVLPSGQIVFGGAFQTVAPNLGTSVNVQALARVNKDGTLDTTFYPDPNSPVTAIIVLPNGQLVVGGSFTTFQQNTNITGVTAGAVVTSHFIGRVNTDGTLDTSFNPNPNGALTTLALQPNGQIILGGSFTTLQPNKVATATNRDNIARVNADGTLDPSFDPAFNGAVNAVGILTDGSVFVGGNFTTIQVGGAVLVGGSFASVGGNAAANLARLNSDGTYDSSFVAHPDGTVNAIAAQANGQTLVGGSFASVDGQARANVARLFADGTLDTTFNPGANAAVNAVTVQADGRIIVGGSFTAIGGQNASYLARLSPAGAPDAGFTPAVNGTVNSVVAQPNGQVVIAGSFTAVAGVPIGGIARLNADGSLDGSFNPNANGPVQALTLQVDGTFYVGGAFTAVGGQSFAHAAHILANGAVDASFNPSPNGTVYAISVQADGKVVVGGSFTNAGGLARAGLARFAAPTPVAQSVSVSTDQSTLSWSRSGGAPQVSAVKFEESTDGTHWTPVGQATSPNGSTWTLTGVAPTGMTTFLVRVTGISPSSQYSSSGLIQTTYLANTLALPIVNSSSLATGTSGAAFVYTVTATQSPKSFSATGLPQGLSINATTGVISGTPSSSGTYNVAVTVGNAGGSTVSSLTISIASSSGTRFAPGGTSAANRLLNLSSRAELTGGQVLIVGFAISGTGPKTVLVRAVGPGLKAFNVPGVMAVPELQIYSASGTIIAQNSGWGGSASLSSTFTQVGAFSLAPGSSDAAVVTDLSPGTYTVHVFDPSGAGGVVLAEIYDASPTPLTAPQRLINISTRGTVSSGAGALIGGFVISGTTTKTVLVRGVGPGLAGFGVTDSLSDPVLSVFDENGNLVAQNLAWGNQAVTGLDQATVSASDIATTGSGVGAFALAPQSTDTALIANLPPGAYTFQVTSAGKSTGEALGEVYELP